MAAAGTCCTSPILVLLLLGAAGLAEGQRWQRTAFAELRQAASLPEEHQYVDELQLFDKLRRRGFASNKIAAAPPPRSEFNGSTAAFPWAVKAAVLLFMAMMTCGKPAKKTVTAGNQMKKVTA